MGGSGIYRAVMDGTKLWLSLDEARFSRQCARAIDIALSLRFVFRKQRINLAETTVFTCFAIGQATLVSVVVGTPLMLVASARVESALFIAASIGYLFYAGLGFFGRSFGTGLRLIGSVVLGIALADGVAFLLPFVLAR